MQYPVDTTKALNYANNYIDIVAPLHSITQRIGLITCRRGPYFNYLATSYNVTNLHVFLPSAMKLCDILNELMISDKVCSMSGAKSSELYIYKKAQTEFPTFCKRENGKLFAFYSLL